MTTTTNKEAILTDEQIGVIADRHNLKADISGGNYNAEIAFARDIIAALPAQVDAQAVAWRMVTPQSGNVFFMTDAAEARRFKEMDGREVRPLVFGDVVPAASPSVQGESIDSERAAFEKWFAADGGKVGKMGRDSDDEYTHALCRGAHAGWQARARLARTAAPSERKWSAEEICDACVKSGLGILEAQNLMVTLKGERSAEMQAVIDKLAHRAAPSEGLAIPNAAAPAEYQYRTRPTWRADGEGWSEWTKCSAESYEDYRKVPKLHDWQYQTRELFLRTPATEQAKPELAGLSMGAVWRTIDAAMPMLDEYHCPALLALSKADKGIFARAILAAQPVPQASGERDAALAEAVKACEAQQLNNDARSLSVVHNNAIECCIHKIKALKSSAATTRTPPAEGAAK